MKYLVTVIGLILLINSEGIAQNSQYDLENYKYSPDFHFDKNFNGITILKYENGVQTAQMFSNDGVQCDSIVKYHPNGQISLKAKLISYEKKLDSTIGEYQYRYNYYSECYWENGRLARTTLVRDTLFIESFFDKKGMLFYYSKIENSLMIEGSRNFWIDEETGLISLFHAGRNVVEITFNKTNMNIIDYVFQENEKKITFKSPPSIIEFDNHFYPNNVQLFNLKVSIK